MRIAVFGATGAVGREVVSAALGAGHAVRAYVRPASASALSAREGLEVVEGELDDEAAIARCVEGADAVINALGARANTRDQPALFGEALARVVSAMEAHGVRRIASLAGAAVAFEGDRGGLVHGLVSGILRRAARHVLAAKEAEVAVLRASALDWVVLRPPRIVDGAPTGRWVADLHAPPATSIPRGDVADALLTAAVEDRWIRQAPFVATP